MHLLLQRLDLRSRHQRRAFANNNFMRFFFFVFRFRSDRMGERAFIMAGLWNILRKSICKLDCVHRWISLATKMKRIIPKWTTHTTEVEPFNFIARRRRPNPHTRIQTFTTHSVIHIQSMPSFGFVLFISTRNLFASFNCMSQKESHLLWPFIYLE